MGDDPDEGGMSIIRAEQVEQLAVREGAVRRGIDGAEYPAIHGDKMRSEDDFDRLAGDVGQRLLDLRGVPMLADAVRGDALVAFGKMKRRLGLATAAGHTVFAVNNDVGKVDVIAGHQ